MLSMIQLMASSDKGNIDCVMNAPLYGEHFSVFINNPDSVLGPRVVRTTNKTTPLLDKQKKATYFSVLGFTSEGSARCRPHAAR